MKKYRLLALIAGIACVAAISIWAVFSLGNQPEETPDQKDPPNQSQESTETDPVENKNEDPADAETEAPSDGETEAPSDAETDDQKEPSQNNESTKDPEEPVDNSDAEDPADDANEPVVSGKLNPNPTTKEEIEAVLNDPYMMLVNRDRKLSSDFKAPSLVNFRGYKLNKTCADALGKLMNAGKAAGYNYTMYSGYRTYSTQYNKYYNKIAYYKNNGYSESEAIRLTDQYYAPPGGSEHHTGLAADVCTAEIVNKYACLHENYDQTEEFEWFSTHAHEYGFILRYQKGAESITGYNYEPWHYRYVGVEVATWIYEQDITFEEYIEGLEARLEALN